MPNETTPAGLPDEFPEDVSDSGLPVVTSSEQLAEPDGDDSQAIAGDEGALEEEQ